MIYPLKNVLKNYPWGSKTAMTTLFGFANPNNEPQAELWMGAHPSGCSMIVTETGEKRLDDFIAENPTAILGDKVAAQFDGLPFLLKILSAETPLSVQVHPSKTKAEIGFAKENAEGIALDAPNRNYKDSNHKPELVYALTDYEAMNGFREIPEMIALFDVANVPTLASALQDFKLQPNEAGLAHFFARVMSLNGVQKAQAVQELLDNIDNKGNSELEKSTFALVQRCADLYPNDVGLFAPLLLNIITLHKGEAMFLHAETPHAYLRGTGIEIMASSDNVLRSGLTPKHIDIDELLDNIKYRPMPLSTLTTAPVVDDSRVNFPVPVNDFAIDIITVAEGTEFTVNSAEILLCLNGEVTVNNTLTLSRGKSLFVAAESKKYSLSGAGQLVRAYNAME